ncbi:MAG: tRNA uridine-5-carboxymethylaminomethyl(34) synthesis GTPase MnmE [Paludibacteraceae bacterium]|nr:tRNA uridine-5-carboxymethylaminomethyl(34) synthesis GTPase MnmE [Paludibacteraceae bacterium]
MSKPICAISTPNGVGGIAVIRVSGDGAAACVDRIFRARKEGDNVSSQRSHTVKLGSIIDLENAQTELDEVVVTRFCAPHSYTGEEVVEIACHGSVYIQQRIVQLLLQSGCTMARAGEFTQRAFLNGRLDLSQAEGVADLISSTSAAGNRLTMRQMKGGVSNEIRALRDQLMHLSTLLELELDFSEEDVLFADRNELAALTTKIEQRIDQLTKSFAVGNAIKNGIPVAIVGQTNVGKSTLLNALVGEERALVSEIHGTTRDTLEDLLVINGLLFRFIDTAGIRETQDVVEQMGIDRSYQTISKAQIVLWIIDGSHHDASADRIAKQIRTHASASRILPVLNKADKIAKGERVGVMEQYRQEGMEQPIFISAKSGENLDALKLMLVQIAQIPDLSKADTYLTNLRHYEAFMNAQEALRRFHSNMSQNLSSDLLAEDLRACLEHLGEVTGQITSSDILQNIFSHFCIGK